MTRSKRFSPLVLIILFGVIGAKALLHFGFYTSHDGENQRERLFAFDQGLRDGQMPVRYNRQLYNGLGYPLFTFTYQVPFMIGEVFHTLRLSFADSIKATFFVTYILSGLTMYWFVSRYGRLPGLVAAILYLWAPYRFVVMFVRAALGEHVAFVFAPLLMGSMDSTNVKKKGMIIGGIAFAGLLLSHAMIAQILFFPLTFWVIAQLLLSKKKKKYLVHLIGIFLLGVLLSAYYLFPTTVYRPLIQRLNPFFFSDHFVTVQQLWYSPWGYAFSMKGTDQDGMSFQIGAAQWLTVGFSILFISAVLFKTIKIVRRSSKLIITIIALMFGVVMSAFLMTEFSQTIWEMWRNTATIDIPWRFLFVTTLETSILGGVLISTLKKKSMRVFLACVIISLALYENRHHLRVNKYVSVTDDDLMQFKGTTNTEDEYRPVWDDLNLSTHIRSEANISNSQGHLMVLNSNSKQLRMAIDSPESTRVSINTLYFPGWGILVDGQPQEFKYLGEGGIMRVDVTSGPHVIEAMLKETNLEKFSDTLTLVTMVFMIGAFVWQYKKNHASL